MIEKSYNNFNDKEVVNLERLGDINLLELYKGPTLAFKDIAMQVIGNLYGYLKVAKEKPVNILVATSGAIAANDKAVKVAKTCTDIVTNNISHKLVL